MASGSNPKSKANLIKWEKGQSGNAKGRPKAIPNLVELLGNALGHEVNKDGKTVAQVILEQLSNKAARGDIRAAELLLDRAWGKATQMLHVTTNDVPLIARIEIVKIVRDDKAESVLPAGEPEPNT